MSRPKRQAKNSARLSREQEARRLKSEIALRGLTQVALAEELGVHLNTISAAINHGLNEPTLVRIKKRLGLAA